MKKSIKNFQQNYPIIESLIIAIIYLLLFKSIGFLTTKLISSNGYIAKLIPECAGIILSLLIITVVGKLDVIKQNGSGILNGLLTGGFLVVISLLGLIANLEKLSLSQHMPQRQPLIQIIIFILTMLSVGITEEFVYRGAITNIIADKYAHTSKGVYLTVFVSGLIFGSSHLTNMLSGVTFESAFVQAVVASVLGAFLAAVYLRTKNIWTVVIIHAFVDFSSLIISGFYRTHSFVDEINNYRYINLISVIIYLVPVLIILRGSKIKEILGRSKNSSGD